MVAVYWYGFKVNSLMLNAIAFIIQLCGTMNEFLNALDEELPDPIKSLLDTDSLVANTNKL